MTVMVCATPTVAVEERPERMNWLAWAGLTLIPESVPVVADVAISVAVIDWLPAVLSVTVKVYVPRLAVVKAKFAGSPAERRCWRSELCRNSRCPSLRSSSGR